MPKITLNGEEKSVTSTTVTDLLLELNISLKYVLVEYNGEAVFHKEYSATNLKDGDRIEVARPMSGG